MSKSVGNALDTVPVTDLYGLDALRLLPVARGAFGATATSDTRAMHERYQPRSRQRPRQPRLAQHRDGDASRRDGPGGRAGT